MDRDECCQLNSSVTGGFPMLHNAPKSSLATRDSNTDIDNTNANTDNTTSGTIGISVGSTTETNTNVKQEDGDAESSRRLRPMRGNNHGNQHHQEQRRYAISRSYTSRNVRMFPVTTACIPITVTSDSDRNLARTLEDLLNQREQLQGLHNWYQYDAVLKVLDDKLEETRLRLFYGPDFDIERFKRWRVAKGGESAKRNSVEIGIPKDRGGHQNLVGRLVGPSGMTVKQLERDLNCKISIRGAALKRNSIESKLHGDRHEDESVDDETRDLYMVATVPTGAVAPAHLDFIEQALRHFVHNAVSTNADFDVLKKWQLIDLSKFRGQYRPNLQRIPKRNNVENTPPQRNSTGVSTNRTLSIEKSVTFPAIQVPVRFFTVAPSGPAAATDYLQPAMGVRNIDLGGRVNTVSVMPSCAPFMAAAPEAPSMQPAPLSVPVQFPVPVTICNQYVEQASTPGSSATADLSSGSGLRSPTCSHYTTAYASPQAATGFEQSMSFPLGLPLTTSLYPQQCYQAQNAFNSPPNFAENGRVLLMPAQPNASATIQPSGFVYYPGMYVTQSKQQPGYLQ